VRCNSVCGRCVGYGVASRLRPACGHYSNKARKAARCSADLPLVGDSGSGASSIGELASAEANFGRPAVPRLSSTCTQRSISASVTFGGRGVYVSLIATLRVLGFGLLRFCRFARFAKSQQTPVCDGVIHPDAFAHFPLRSGQRVPSGTGPGLISRRPGRRLRHYTILQIRRFCKIV